MAKHITKEEYDARVEIPAPEHSDLCDHNELQRAHLHSACISNYFICRQVLTNEPGYYRERTELNAGVKFVYRVAGYDRIYVGVYDQNEKCWFLSRGEDIFKPTMFNIQDGNDLYLTNVSTSNWSTFLSKSSAEQFDEHRANQLLENLTNIGYKVRKVPVVE
jgi:hypothetical protein